MDPIQRWALLFLAALVIITNVWPLETTVGRGLAIVAATMAVTVSLLGKKN